MTNEQLLDRVTIDSAVCHGQPCIRATRVLGHRRPLRLAAGMSAAQIVEHYPTADCRRRPRSRGLWSLVREAGDPRAYRRPREDQARREHHRIHNTLSIRGR